MNNPFEMLMEQVPVRVPAVKAEDKRAVAKKVIAEQKSLPIEFDVAVELRALRELRAVNARARWDGWYSQFARLVIEHLEYYWHDESGDPAVLI